MKDVESVDNPEAGSYVSTKAMMTTPGITPTLAQRIREADKNSSGNLSLAELMQVFKSEQEASLERRILRRIALMMGIMLLLLSGAMAGLTYGMVYLLKDTKVDNGGVLVDKTSADTIATGSSIQLLDLASLYTYTLADLINIDNFMVQQGNNYMIHKVAAVSLVPGTSAEITTATGQVFTVTSAGIGMPSSGSPSGRHLLQANVTRSARAWGPIRSLDKRFELCTLPENAEVCKSRTPPKKTSV